RRMMMIVCLYSASSHLQRTNLQSFSHIKPAGSLRAQESFVSCKAEYIHMHGFDINRENPRRLGCIHNIENTMVMCHLSDPSNINQISRQIGSVCRHDGLCLWTDCLLDLFITDPALVITLYKSHFHSFFLKIIDRPEDRIMLQYSRNYMISRIYQSPNCRIQAFGRIGCKRDLLRILRTKELCQA